ncbi:MAG: hypothetical protein JXX14_08235, partial [Deltaproteobacteria bacterium]|nr:hypothetical protein [Deltaproteobacteria bacterium]
MKQIQEIRVGVSSCGLAAGAGAVLAKLKARCDVSVIGVGCIGHCYAEPLVEVVTPEETVYYRNITDNDDAIDAILSLSNENRLHFGTARRHRENLRLTGIIGKFEPVDLDAYVAHGGFLGLEKALTLETGAVVAAVTDAGLRGRGGGGFPTG